jgi:stress response protein SCP2
MIEVLLKKKLVFPKLPAKAGRSESLARQLDVALMKGGFKLSHALLEDIAHSSAEDAFNKAVKIITAAQELVGAHVEHNVYFAKFPKGVPATEEFWFKCLVQLFVTGDCDYGRYGHTFEEMLAFHSALKLKKPGFRVIQLGGTLEEEQRQLFLSLATSKVPLNEEDRALLGKVVRREYLTGLQVPIRENKAIINGIRLLQFDDPNIEVDTPIDVLRLAAYLSDGDVTLAAPTKFKSFKRPVRRCMVAALSAMIEACPAKIDDVAPYREEFKRLAERIHPREFQQYAFAQMLFSFVFGTYKRNTFANRVHVAIALKYYQAAIELLSQKPGLLVRSADKIMRDCNDEDFGRLVTALKNVCPRVAGRVLLSLDEHLLNRSHAKGGTRIFINRKGGGYGTPNVLPPITAKRYNAVHAIILEEIARRIPAVEELVLGEGLERVALPLSEKSKSAGFNVLPRGSTFALDPSKKRLRFFMYWRQCRERTDYDLSCIFLNRSFEFITQLSWTNLRESGFGSHSGDITAAPEGATEMIEIQLNKLPEDVAFLLPSVNNFAGESFSQVEESFFGFMMRDDSEKGAPFEAAIVQNKFELRGPSKLFLPIIFARDAEGWMAKWLDLNCAGLKAANRVEQNRFSTTLLAKAIYERDYLNMAFLAALYQQKAKAVRKAPAKAIKVGQGMYVGMKQPDEVGPGAKAYTLSTFKDLIPA